MLNGKDTAGNEVTVEKKVLTLDLDKPKVPVINSNASYATLYEYGVAIDAATNIVYDTRTDIDNYYSIDGGINWLIYSGQFNMTSGTVMAKSVKKTTGLEVSISKTISMPSDALQPQAYDGNTSTSAAMAGKYIRVDSSMQGKRVRIYLSGYSPSAFACDSNRNRISTLCGSGDNIVTLPANTCWISGSDNGYAGCSLIEIQGSNEPTFTKTNGYMLLHMDVTKAIKEPYQMITISYSTTSVQRLYRIGTSGEWLSYEEQSVKVNEGQTIYAKGIDKNGNETRIISSYTASVADALKKEAYDGNTSTSTAITGMYMKVDSSMQGKRVRIYLSGYSPSAFAYDANRVKIATLCGSGDNIVTLPANTYWISGTNNGYSGGSLIEIQPADEPTFSGVNGYMLLHADPTKAIKEPYQMVTLNYFPTSLQRLYKIGINGNWLDYSDIPISVNEGQTIYAKGIDKDGNQTRIIASYTPTVPDALKKEAYDGNDSTSTPITGMYMKVDPSMQGKKVRIYISGYSPSVFAYDINKNRISTLCGSGNNIVTIPINTYWITGTSNGYAGGYLIEIGPQ